MNNIQKVQVPHGKTLIQAKDVEKNFQVGEQEVKVLKGISLSIDSGDFVIIFGPSGCGKSTLLHGILGLEGPSKGSISFSDKDLYALNEDQRVEYRKSNIGMIYQQSIWIKSLNVLRNVSFPLDLYGLDEDETAKKAGEVLKIVEMEEWKDHWPTELSSGQQQRVSAARALITDPVLIIADEPTGNLDSASGKELMDLLSGLNKKGKTVIMVTHDLAYLTYANRIFHIVDGLLEREYLEKDKAELIRKLSLDLGAGGAKDNKASKDDNKKDLTGHNAKSDGSGNNKKPMGKNVEELLSGHNGNGHKKTMLEVEEELENGKGKKGKNKKEDKESKEDSKNKELKSEEENKEKENKDKDNKGEKKFKFGLKGLIKKKP